jgi:hypothetical protein
MEKTREQVSLSHTIRLAEALLKSCLLYYPRLEDQIRAQINFEPEEEPNTKDWPIEEIASGWFGKDFLEYLFGIEDLLARCPDVSGGAISELRKKGVTRIFGQLKGERYEAELTEDSKVRTLHDGKEYDSLSAAASSVCGYPVNGKIWWRYLKGEVYCPLKDLLDSESAEKAVSSTKS